MNDRADEALTLPYAYLVSLTTHQMLYQEVVVESETPLAEDKVILNALEQAKDKWEPGPIEKMPDVDGIRILRQKEHFSGDSSSTR